MVNATHSYGDVRRCETTGKLRYPSKGAARRIMRKAGNRIRPYRCPGCQGWHVTKQLDLDGDFSRREQRQDRSGRRARRQRR